MIGGELGHKDLESYLKGAGLTDRIRPYKMYAEGIMNCPKDKLLVEEQIAIDKGLKIVDWFSPFAWGRGIIDVAIIKGTTALIYDWKFGRRKLDDLQLKIFCFFLALKYPDIEKFESSFIYLKEENPADAVVSLKGGFTREDLVNVWLEIEPRVKRMEDAFNTSIFSKKTSGLCHGWCAVTECTHWSERRKKCK